MFSRLGLRSQMGVSYVLVSAAAVLVVEAVLLAVMMPRISAANERVEEARRRAVQAELAGTQDKTWAAALEIAVAVGEEAGRAAAGAPGQPDEALLSAGGRSKAFDAKIDARRRSDDTSAFRALATVDGRIVASSAGTGPAAPARLPGEAVSPTGAAGRTLVDGRTAVWVVRPVELAGRVIGLVYLRLVVQGEAASSPKFAGEEARIQWMLLPGGIVLLLLLPVGAVFGLLSTGRLIRRIRRLAEGTTAMAGGDLTARMPVSGGDEVGRLEQAFNSMAERLEAAVQAERTAADERARRAERTRITRELHDSISQDLFSASLLAGGLRKALPAGSDLGHRAASLETALARTMREMRAMLLELRPVALEDAGLTEAIDRLCRAYEGRLGISIATRIDPPRLDAPVEHAVLRVVQEALGNAVRHGQPGTIELRVAGDEGQVAVTVCDDGRGFDPVRDARHGMGLSLMRERVGELGGTFEVVSAPDRGTTVTVLLPAGVR